MFLLTELCLELFPDYIRHCARKLSKMLLKNDKFCSDFSIDCLLGVGQPQKVGIDDGEGRERKDVADEVDENTTTPISSTPSSMGNGTVGNGTTVEEEPDELPPLDFSLRRPPPPPVPQFGRQYIAQFCCRHQQRFECLCRSESGMIGIWSIWGYCSCFLFPLFYWLCFIQS